MKNDKFCLEYRNSVDSVKLPENYKEKILSGLSEEFDNTDEKSGFMGKVTPLESARRPKVKFIGSMVAAVLVIAVTLGVMFSVRIMIPSSKEVRFTVSCATNLQRVQGARVVFLSNTGETLKDKDGKVYEAYTDEKGQVAVTIPYTEDCSAQVSLDGYITATEEIDSENIYVSPVMNEDTYRAVLRWSEDMDLDSIFTVTSDKGIEKLDYFNSDIEDKEGQVIATLDVDSDTPDSPETITFNVEEGAVFRFSVASYSSLKERKNKDIANSGAMVTLYRGSECIGVYRAENKPQGNAWCVFEVEGDILRLCDYTYTIENMKDIK